MQYCGDHASLFSAINNTHRYLYTRNTYIFYRACSCSCFTFSTILALWRPFLSFCLSLSPFPSLVISSVATNPVNKYLS